MSLRDRRRSLHICRVRGRRRNCRIARDWNLRRRLRLRLCCRSTKLRCLLQWMPSLIRAGSILLPQQNASSSEPLLSFLLSPVPPQTPLCASRSTSYLVPRVFSLSTLLERLCASAASLVVWPHCDSRARSTAEQRRQRGRGRRARWDRRSSSSGGGARLLTQKARKTIASREPTMKAHAT